MFFKLCLGQFQNKDYLITNNVSPAAHVTPKGLCPLGQPEEQSVLGTKAE